MSKRKIIEFVDSFDAEQLNGSVTNTIKYLQSLKRKHGEFHLSCSPMIDDYGNDCFNTFYISIERTETDKEAKDRIKHNRKKSVKGSN